MEFLVILFKIELDDSNVKEKANEDDLAEQEEKIRDTYMFRPGRLPPSRQVFYQYKSLEVQKAQAFLKEYKLSAEQKCDERNGWYKKGKETGDKRWPLMNSS